MLYHHYLLGKKKLNARDIPDIIRRLGCIQYDPLDIIGKNHHLVLQSRVKNYKIEYLNEYLYKDRILLEGWDKMMSIYSLADWPYFKRFREAQKNHNYRAKQEILDFVPKIREHLIKHGSSSSINIETDIKLNWFWNPSKLSKIVMESMFFWGELQIVKRVNTRRIFDFTEKYLNSEILEAEDPNLELKDYWEWHVLRRISGLGIINPKSAESWMGIHKHSKEMKALTLKSLLQKNLITELKIEGINKIFYLRNSDYENYQANKPESIGKRLSFIAPLDNLIWDRSITKDLFDFEYTWEVYTPQSKRKFAYYVLPILFKDRFIGRFEPVYDKKNQSLILKNIWFEKNLKITAEMKQCFQTTLSEFKEYLQAEHIIYDNKGNQSGFLSNYITK